MMVVRVIRPIRTGILPHILGKCIPERQYVGYYPEAYQFTEKENIDIPALSSVRCLFGSLLRIYFQNLEGTFWAFLAFQQTRQFLTISSTTG